MRCRSPPILLSSDLLDPNRADGLTYVPSDSDEDSIALVPVSQRRFQIIVTHTPITHKVTT